MISPPYERLAAGATADDTDGTMEYSDGESWFSERNLCRHCEDEQRAAGKPFRWADPQVSFGIYAGRYCEVCWPKSGFRDATDPDAKFDPADAGERLEPEDY